MPPPPSHTQPPNTEPNLKPEASHSQNLMSVPYSDHHAHTSLSFYSKTGLFGAAESSEPKQYNFDTDVGVDQSSLRRRLSFPYLYSPFLTHSFFHSPVLHSHLHSSDIEFPSSLISASTLHSSGNGHPLHLRGTENDDDIITFSGSRDSHVIELPELWQSTVRKSDSVLPYHLLFPPFSPPHTQSPLTSLTAPMTTDSNQQETGGSAGGAEATSRSPSEDDQHRQDFQNGRIDYYGRDSFENIQQRIDALLLEDEEEENRLGVAEPDREGHLEEEGVSFETGQEEDPAT